jgi:hypothetical protein
MRAEAHDIDLSHSGREHSEKIKGEQGGPGSRSAPLALENEMILERRQSQIPWGQLE